VKMMKVGDRFHNLVAHCRTNRKSGSGNYYWIFKCDCGGWTESLPANVCREKGGTISCGCVQKSRQHGKAWLKRMIFDYKKHAKKLSVSYELTLEKFEMLCRSNCCYCGRAGRNGIDRVNPTKGYTQVNCVPCCKICNYMKRSMLVDSFLSHIEKIYNCTVSSVE